MRQAWRRWRLAILTLGILAQAGLAQAGTPQAPFAFLKPAYITNAYFSDQVTEGENGAVRPHSAVKALRNRASGPLGYLILDLILVKPGEHTLRLDIINQQGEKVGESGYPLIKMSKQGELPLYTAATPLSGKFSAGLWFFKIWDQVAHGTWYRLGVFSIMVVDVDEQSKIKQ
ncbi:MAG: hypothetical protein HQL87_13460 [Magnetococcales bacterium]|nr:hypothetical protein [Magnetococcales bacterium]